MTILIDIETRSRADLPEVGAYRYGCDPSTEVLMMGVATDVEGSPVYLWVNPKYENAGIKSDPMAIHLLRNATKVVAHNAPFEISVLEGTGWDPFIPLDRWHCTAAMARVAGIADSLEKCGAMLGLEIQKNTAGKALIKLFSIPREDGTFNQPTDFPDEWAQFCEYCRTDVEVERRIWHKLASFRLSGINWDTWQFTLRMNSLGIPVNVPALRNAAAILDEVTKTSAAEFTRLTGLNITQREKIRQWLGEHGVQLDNMQGDTLEFARKSIADLRVQRVVELYLQLSYAAVKKVGTMLGWAMPDQRMRGVFKFYGTGTGRWSAGGPQIQNAKKATPEMRPMTKAAYKAICDGASAEAIDSVYGNPVEVLASCVRHFIHMPDSRMLDADYNAIEARIACWLSDDANALDEYRRGIDRYRLMAALIFNKGTSAVTPDERDLGKQAILGLSYGMGAEKFRTSCEAKGMAVSAKLAEDAKNAFRQKHVAMCSLWRSLDFSIKQAIAFGTTHWPRKNIGVGISGDWCKYLVITLPSGRKLYYPKPQLDEEGNPCYFGQLSMSAQWGMIKLYGAKAFENICQAVAADLMSHGAREAESKWMLPFALIHDQALAIHADGQSPDQFAHALQQLPSWAHGLPLKAEAKLTDYYQK